jgi:hypothetical protein
MGFKDPLKGHLFKDCFCFIMAATRNAQFGSLFENLIEFLQVA